MTSSCNGDNNLLLISEMLQVILFEAMLQISKYDIVLNHVSVFCSL